MQHFTGGGGADKALADGPNYFHCNLGLLISVLHCRGNYKGIRKS